jgi:signal recognition particle subunit SRP54
MFDNFSQKITKIFSQISGKKFISESALDETLREIRIALLEADVALSVAKDFIEKIRQQAIGKEVIRSVSAGEMIIKIVHDQLVELLGSDKCEVNLNQKPPVIILMVGLQASGKTTTSAKLALRLAKKSRKKVLLASLDTYRPAAALQLANLASKIGVKCDEFEEGKTPLELARKAQKAAISDEFDVLILDSAGRTVIDEVMMNELCEISLEIVSRETLLVVDSMIGQDAVNVAKHFSEKLNLTGVILTRLDGDSRGGAALTMKAITNCPIKFIGTGEKLEDLEEFNPDRIASRIVGMGDVVSLVEKAQEIFNVEEMEGAAHKLREGKFNFDDMLSQMRNMKRMGGMSSIINLLPGMGAIKEQLKNMTHMEKELKMQEAIILSMTKRERKKPDIISTSRKFRIAKGSGTTIQEINRLIKKFKQTQKMMGKLHKFDPKELEKMMSEEKESLFNKPIKNRSFR